MKRLMPTIAALLVACSGQPSGEDTDYDPYQRPDAAQLECVPNLDGRVDADELQPALGVEANYIVSPAGETRTVDLKGESKSGKGRLWDWSATNQQDQKLGISAREIDGKWYADSFPNGEFALPIDLSGETEGVYRGTDAKMLLLGVASKKKNPSSGKTLLKYESPVEVYRFPVKKGDKWVSTGKVNDGTLRGAPYAGKDVYRVEVKAVGEMKLPNFTFEQVHRVDTQVTVQPAAGKSVARRQVSFLAECFGEVARATSKDGVTKDNFTTAAEVRRLGTQE